MRNRELEIDPVRLQDLKGTWGSDLEMTLRISSKSFLKVRSMSLKECASQSLCLVVPFESIWGQMCSILFSLWPVLFTCDTIWVPNDPTCVSISNLRLLQGCADPKCVQRAQ